MQRTALIAWLAPGVVVLAAQTAIAAPSSGSVCSVKRAQHYADKAHALQLRGSYSAAAAAYVAAQNAIAECVPSADILVDRFAIVTRGASMTTWLSLRNPTWRANALEYFRAADMIRGRIVPQYASRAARDELNASDDILRRARTAFAAAPSLGPATRQSVAVDGEDCETETLQAVSEDGSVLELLDGRRFLVAEADRVVTALWLPTEDLVVCDPGPGRAATFIKDGDKVYAGHL